MPICCRSRGKDAKYRSTMTSSCFTAYTGSMATPARRRELSAAAGAAEGSGSGPCRADRARPAQPSRRATESDVDKARKPCRHAQSTTRAARLMPSWTGKPRASRARTRSSMTTEAKTSTSETDGTAWAPPPVKPLHHEPMWLLPPPEPRTAPYHDPRQEPEWSQQLHDAECKAITIL